MKDIELVKEVIAGGLDPGEPRSLGSLTVVPLFGGAIAKDYALAAAAIQRGLLSIQEIGGGHVPELVARNKGSLPVLLIDGEHLEGALQNRVLNVTVLAGAGRDTVLPVSCVEEGRWHYDAGEDLRSSADVIAYSRLRGLNAEAAALSARATEMRTVDQGAVWDDVATKHAEVGVFDSGTGAMRDAYDGRRKEIARVLERAPRPEPGQTGVIACVGGRPVALDAFDRPETLAALWARLLSGYALDALGAPVAEPKGSDIASFLGAGAEAEATSHPGVGLGTDVVLTSPSVVGGALAWEDGIVHIALFARRAPVGIPDDLGSPIASPAARRSFRRGVI